jgi:hypothetical protein
MLLLRRGARAGVHGKLVVFAAHESQRRHHEAKCQYLVFHFALDFILQIYAIIRKQRLGKKVLAAHPNRSLYGCSTAVHRLFNGYKP